MMPTIGCEEGTLFSSFSVLGGCGTVTSCAGIVVILETLDVYCIKQILMPLYVKTLSQTQTLVGCTSI